MDSGGLVERFERWSAEKSQRRALIVLGHDENETDALDFAGLHRRASAFAEKLCALDVQGRAVLILSRGGIPFAVALLSCFYAGAIAVPCSTGARNRARERIAAIAGDCRPVAAVIGPDEAGELRQILEDLSLPALAVDGTDAGGAARAWTRPASVPALLQYTSGSTGSPKGVVLSEANLVANLNMLSTGFGVDEQSVYLTWLPLFHDMGLIANLLAALYSGVPCVLMQPLQFYQRPERWLRAIGKFRATISGGPNFAFELLLRKAADRDLTGIDLSSWRVAFCGAEVVRAETMRRFADRFAPCGFRAAALFPCYGLAEATVFVSGAEPDQGFQIARREARDVVSLGWPATGSRVRIVDPDTSSAISDGGIGEIWVAGEHVSSGYWDKPELSDRTFRAMLPSEPGVPFLRTGDLGWMEDGALYFAGRLKDVIKWRGSSIFPEDVEAAASSAVDLPPASAAFAVESGEGEAIVLFQEVMTPLPPSFEPVKLLTRLSAAVMEACAVPLHDAVLVRRGTLPRTTSGKVQRKRCEALYASIYEADMTITGLRALRKRPLKP